MFMHRNASEENLQALQAEMLQAQKCQLELSDSIAAYEMQLEEVLRLSMRAEHAPPDQGADLNTDGNPLPVDYTTMQDLEDQKSVIQERASSISALQQYAADYTQAHAAHMAERTAARQVQDDRRLAERMEGKLPDTYSHLSPEDSISVYSADCGSAVDDVTPLGQSTTLLLPAPPLPCMLTFDGYYNEYAPEGVQAGCGAQLRLASGELLWQGSERITSHSSYEAATCAALMLGLHAALDHSLTSIVAVCRSSAVTDHIRGCTSAGGGAGPSMMGDIPPLLQQLDTFRVVLGASQGGDATSMAQAAAKQRTPLSRSRPPASKEHHLQGGESRAEATEGCRICLEQVPTTLIYVIGGCLHRFCNSCISQYAAGCIADQKYPIRCPAIACDTALSLEECRLFMLTEPHMAALETLATKAAVPQSQRFYCPVPTCSAMLILDEAPTPGIASQCPNCGTGVCSSCKALAHPTMSCAEMRASTETDDTALYCLAEKERYRSCPACEHMIELLEGCMHITCKCGHHFCYTCGASYKDNKQSCKCDLFTAPPETAARAVQRDVFDGGRVNLYRTVLCRYYEEGYCRAGGRCNFAHGDNQLR